MKRFEDYFQKIENQCPTLCMTPETEKKIEDFIEKLIEAKMKEYIHMIDNGSERKRWKTGISGELAVEKLLGIRFFNWSIGHSRDYNTSDLLSYGLNVGVKTVEYGKFPIIHKKVIRPEIIVVKKGNRFFVCGLATTRVLKLYQDDDLILSPKLRARNVKTGFYGFEHLVPFRTLLELKTILRKNKIAS